ncbi:VWA domain-containing protein [Pseudorhodoferax sp.]|uniref:VWA domain-containing protein n=1 Tax=Pseudorhodoferax sp. TaxID=1993553 RepID=UPI0039E41387
MTTPPHFLWPQLLWLLWAIPLLMLAYLWLLRRRRQPVLRYASLALVRQAAPRHPAWRRHVPPALLLAALAVLLLAAARPQAALPLPTEQATVMLAVDVSLSMQADDIQPSRLDAAREAAKAFVRRLPAGVRVGVVGFSASAEVVQPPTYSREDLLAAIDRLQLERGTAVGSGIAVALAELLPGASIDVGDALDTPLAARPATARPAAAATAAAPQPHTDSQATIVLLTDGRSNFGVHPLDAAGLAARHGVRIHAVGLGTRQPDAGGEDNWSALLQPDEDTLREVTALTHGEYFRAASAESLVQVYEQMGARMRVQVRETELSAPLALAALLLLAGAALLSLLWFQRVA